MVATKKRTPATSARGVEKCGGVRRLAWMSSSSSAREKSAVLQACHWKNRKKHWNVSPRRSSTSQLIAVWHVESASAHGKEPEAITEGQKKKQWHATSEGQPNHRRLGACHPP